MALTVPELLKMSQKELDDLFTKSDPGPIPNGAAEGTAIIAPGTTFSPEIAKFVNLFAWQGKTFDGPHGVLRNRILPHRAQRDRRRSVQRSELAGRQGVHRPRLFEDVARRAVDSRRDPAGRTRRLYLGKVYWEKKRLIDFALHFE